MAESSGQEKTEKATPKKRREAREKGNVFQSKDVVSVASIFACFYAIKFTAPFMVDNAREFLVSSINNVADLTDVNYGTLRKTLYSLLIYTLKMSIVLLFISVLIAFIAVGIQTKFNFSRKAMKPDFKKLNPLKGLKNIVSLKNIVELFKNLIKVSLLIFLTYDIIRKELYIVPKTMNMSVLAGCVYLFEETIGMAIKIGIAFLIISFIDFLYQRWNYEKELMMTKQELKEEFKQVEGNPEIKGKIKELQRQRAKQRMMQGVKNADVIIRNPTHYAVALKYDHDKDDAPRVIAKGVDFLALRIVDVAEKNGIYIVENRALARSIYAKVDVGRNILPEHYGAVADLLIYVYKLQNKLNEAVN